MNEDFNEELEGQGLEQSSGDSSSQLFPASRKSKGSKSKNNSSILKDAVTGIADDAKNAIKDKINDKLSPVKDKIDDKKNAIKDKIDDKKNAAKSKIDDKKNAIKDKIGSKIPDSVKQKKDQLKGKADQMKNKVDGAKNKVNGAKQQFDKAKRDLNLKTFKSVLKTTVDAFAPGAGEVAQKLLDTEKGKPIKEKVAEASNPVSATIEGTKETVKLVLTEALKKSIIALVPVFVCIFTVVVIILGIVGKVLDSQNFFSITASAGDADAKYEEKYEKFYQNIEKHGGSNKEMVVSVLTAYKDNDAYSADSGYEDGECTDAEKSDGTCVEIVEDGISKYSKSKMKKYIKKVAKAIDDSGGDVTEGSYSNPGSSGSEFFRWLYEDFVEEYYNDGSSLEAEAKTRITKYIYLYYYDLKKKNPDSSTTTSPILNSSCPGVQVIMSTNSSCSGTNSTTFPVGTYDLEEYIAMVVNAENSSGYEEAEKAQIIAARTYTLAVTDNCSRPIENSTRNQCAKANPSERLRNLVNETAGQVLTYNGQIFTSEYDSFKGSCSDESCTGTYTKQPNGETHTVTIPKTFDEGLGGHGRGMSQVGANYMASQGKDFITILKYFYSDGVEISSGLVSGDITLPVPTSGPWRNYLSRGYQVGTAACYSNGVYTGSNTCDHLALDFGAGVTTGDPIYAIMDGVVIKSEFASDGYGNKVILGHDTNNDGEYDYYSLYAHQSTRLVNVGQTVIAGTQIGTLGSTGNSSGPHLHFEIRTCLEKRCAIDPSPIMDSIASGSPVS